MSTAFQDPRCRRLCLGWGWRKGAGWGRSLPSSSSKQQPRPHPVKESADSGRAPGRALLAKRQPRDSNGHREQWALPCPGLWSLFTPCAVATRVHLTADFWQLLCLRAWLLLRTLDALSTCHPVPCRHIPWVTHWITSSIASRLGLANLRVNIISIPWNCTFSCLPSSSFSPDKISFLFVCCHLSFTSHSSVCYALLGGRTKLGVVFNPREKSEGSPERVSQTSC